jgi:hypothetical protein
MEPCTWELPESEIHAKVTANGRRLRDEDGEDRRIRAEAALTLYHANPNYSFGGHTALLGEFTDLQPVGYNVIRACVDTKLNHIIKNRVRPYFLTEKGDSKLKEKALGMQRAVEAEFTRSRIYGIFGEQVTRHGLMFEAGGAIISADYENHCVDVDLIRAHEFLIDPEDADRGKPQEGWLVRPMPRSKLMAKFGDQDGARVAIEAANIARVQSYSSHRETVSDLIDVWEYWHLPSGYVGDDEEDEDGDSKPNHDGIHVICIEGFTLLHEPWPYDDFPIAWFKPNMASTGFWSCGTPERLAGAQLKLNEYNTRIDQIMRAHAVPTLLIDRKAKIKLAKWTNDYAKIIETNGPPSQAAYYLTPQSVPMELFRRVEDLIRWAEKEEGLSEMSIAARKPAGIDHAPGLEHLADTETIRQTTFFRAFEDFHIDAAKWIVRSLRELAKHDPGYTLYFGDSKQLRRIKWADVDIDEERYHLKVWPTNLLPQTPTAKANKAMQFFQLGFWSKEETQLALDFPDIESISGDLTAALENIERMIEDARVGKNPVPEPYMNLALAKTTVINTINRMQADREPEEEVEKIRALYDLVDELIKKAEAAALAAQAAAQGGASAPPMAAPPMAQPTGPAPVPMAS